MFQYPCTLPDNSAPPQMMPPIPHLHHPRIKPDPDIENAVIAANPCIHTPQPIYSVEVPNKYVYTYFKLDTINIVNLFVSLLK